MVKAHITAGPRARVCDGLQAADPRAKMNEVINQESIIDPRLPLLLYTDAKVFEISAKKTISPNMAWSYIVRLEEL